MIGGRVRCRPRLGWLDAVKMALDGRGLTVEAARQCAKDRNEWRACLGESGKKIGNARPGEGD